MNTQNIILCMLVILVLGGLIFYYTPDRWYRDVEEIEEMHEERMGHHEDGRIEPYEIYPDDVVEKIKNNRDIILLDVRTPEEYQEVHLENALLLPVQQLSEQSLSEIGLGENMKHKEIYLYCRSGARSKTAYDVMKSLGYTNVKSIAGGMIHWEEDKHPFTESGTHEDNMAGEEEGMMQGDSSSPQIAFDRTTHDFGVIPQYGGVVTTQFTVTNAGEETLHIGDITTSCSCTSASIARASIDPGESTTLTVTFDPDFHEEPLEVFKRTVFIPTNDPENPEAEVSVTVDIAEGQ